MKILPPRTQPPSLPTQRRHNPQRARGAREYQAYRTCLRWDFGFTCAFCLLHEADFVRCAVRGLGLFTAEHIEPQSVAVDRVNDYTNLVYACRWCNRSRSVASRTVDGSILLEPTQVAWANHFYIDSDELAPRADDPDALYTHAVYNLNDSRKIELRQHRYRVITGCLRLLQEGPASVAEFTHWAQTAPDPGESRTLLEHARTLNESIR